MQDIAPIPESVDDLISEEEQYKFVQAFRNLLRLKNILESFSGFDFDQLGIDEQTFTDYSSKYWDIYDKVKVDHSKEKVSILDDIDFELELLKKDEINIDYILGLLATLVETSDEEKEKQKKNKRKTVLERIKNKMIELLEKFDDL